MDLQNKQRILSNSFSDLTIQILIISGCLLIVLSVFTGIQIISYIAPLFFIPIIIEGFSYLKDDKNLRLLSITIVMFSLWAIITSIWSLYPVYTMIRCLYFVSISFGGVFSSYLWSKRLNRNYLSFLLPVNFLVIFSSVVSVIFNIPINAWSGGNGRGFMGFTTHQNTLAGIILFTLPALVISITALYKTKPNFRIMVLYIFLVANVIFLFLTWSRASFLSLGFSISFYLIYKYKLKAAVILLLTVLLLSILWFTNDGFKYYINKGQTGVWDNRDKLNSASYKAAEDGGLFGLGFGVSDTSISKRDFGRFDKEGKFIREKGNSILACIEEVGLTGTLLLLLILFISYRGISNPDFIQLILICFSLGFLIHSNFEAWIMSVRSPEVFIFFTFLGAFTTFKKNLITS